MPTGLCNNCGKLYDYEDDCPYYCSADCAERYRDLAQNMHVFCGDDLKLKRRLQRHVTAWDARTNDPINIRLRDYQRPQGWH